MKMKAMPTLVMLLALLTAAPVSAQDARPSLDPKLVPMSGAAVSEFVPPGWKIRQQIEGALMSPTSRDTVVQLEASPIVPYGSYGAMLILSRSQSDRLQRVALAVRLVGPRAYVTNLTVAKGVLIVTTLTQVTFADDLVERLQRFRYDPVTTRLVLIGEDITGAWLSGRSVIVSTNHLTGSRITQRRRYDEASGKDIVVSSQKSAVESIQQPFEQVEGTFEPPADQAEATSARQSDRVLLRTPVFNTRENNLTPPGRFVGVPRILLEQFRDDLGDEPGIPEELSEFAGQLTAERLSPAQAKRYAVDGSIPADAEFYSLWGPYAYCGSRGCDEWTYWTSPSTGTSAAL